MTDGCQKRFVPTPGACLSCQPLRYLLAYTSDMGRISVIAYRVDPNTSPIPQHFHHTLSYNQESPLNITPYNLVSRMPSSASDSKPAFIQCGIHSKFGAIFGLVLPNLAPYSMAYCKLVPHYMNAQLREMVAQDLLPRLLTPDAITEAPPVPV